MVLLVNDQQPYKTLKELVDDAKANPDKLIFSSSGLYGALHLPTALFMQAAGIKMKHLPTNGGGPALTAILGNNSQVLVTSIAAASGQIKAGKLRALACFGAQARGFAAGRADAEGARLRRRILALGRRVRAPRARRQADVDVMREAVQARWRHGDQFKTAITNIGDEVAYLDQSGLREILGRGRQAGRSGRARHRPRPGIEARSRVNPEKHSWIAAVSSIGTAALAAAGPAAAQDVFPAHAITIINAFPPGGANDIVTRPLAAAMEPILKQPVVVETKAGAAGAVGAQVAARCQARRLHVAVAQHRHLRLTPRSTSCSAARRRPRRADFIPLARLIADPLRAAGQRSAALQDAEGVHRRRQEKARQAIIYSSGGLYGATHLPVAMLEKAAGGLKLRHLPTNGGGPAITAILGNNAQAQRASRCRPRSRTSRPASCGALACVRRQARRRRCPTCRR